MQQWRRDTLRELSWISHSGCRPRSKMGLSRRMVGPSVKATSWAGIFHPVDWGRPRANGYVKYSEVNSAVQQISLSEGAFAWQALLLASSGIGYDAGNERSEEDHRCPFTTGPMSDRGPFALFIRPGSMYFRMF